MEIKYFNVTEYIKDNFSHKVQPFQFKNYINKMVNIVNEKSEENTMIKQMKKGKNNRTIINIKLVPIFAKWLVEKEVKDDVKIEDVLYELLIDVDSLDKYVS